VPTLTWGLVRSNFFLAICPCPLTPVVAAVEVVSVVWCAS